MFTHFSIKAKAMNNAKANVNETNIFTDIYSKHVLPFYIPIPMILADVF